MASPAVQPEECRAWPVRSCPAGHERSGVVPASSGTSGACGRFRFQKFSSGSRLSPAQASPCRAPSSADRSSEARKRFPRPTDQRVQSLSPQGFERKCPHGFITSAAFFSERRGHGTVGKSVKPPLRGFPERLQHAERRLATSAGSPFAELKNVRLGPRELGPLRYHARRAVGIKGLAPAPRAAGPGSLTSGSRPWPLPRPACSLCSPAARRPIKFRPR